MITIIVNDIYTIIDNPKSAMHTLSIIREVCKARPSGYQFMPKYRQGTWDGYISLMSSFSTFPTGLLSIVLKELDSNNIHYTLVDNTSAVDHTEVISDYLLGIKLRDYQILAANELLESKRGIAKMATNSGKTEVIISIIKSLNVETVIILHRKELMYQTVERIKSRLGIEDNEIGMVGDSILQTDKKITVCMIQTLYNMIDSLDWLNENKLVIIDECHHTSNKQMMNVLEKIPGSYRFGFSGTPLKHDVLADMKLISVTGNVVVDVSNDYLISEGWSAKPVIHIATVEEDDDDLWDMEYMEAYETLIVNYDKRNEIIKSYVEEMSGKSILILVSRIDHGNIFVNMMPYAKFVYGGDSTEYRQDTLQEMRNSDSGVYIASTIFDEGVDVPSVDVIILAGGGKGQTKILQRIGRGLRKKITGENVLYVLDFIDDTNRHLLEHSEERIRTYEQEGFKSVLI